MGRPAAGHLMASIRSTGYQRLFRAPKKRRVQNDGLSVLHLKNVPPAVTAAFTDGQPVTPEKAAILFASRSRGGKRGAQGARRYWRKPPPSRVGL